ncbi:MAG TPA: hypothetical protein VNF07_00445 [Acidimicrobiales bacterium]|nr:hypothetical protein [Acidimicrobiales bacterium]
MSSEGPGGELEPADLAEEGRAEQVQMLAAALRADLADLATYERVLVTSLGETLPEGVLTIDRQRSMGDRVAGRSGEVRAIRVAFGDDRLELERRSGRLVASLTKSVRGVAISHREVSLDEWSAAFASALSKFATENERARLALERLLGA